MTEILRRLPPHLAVFLGASTTGYALSLAGVTALQARAELDLAAARQPAILGVQAVAARPDALARSLAAADSHYQSDVAAYAAAGGRLAELDAALAALAGSVKAINGVTTTLPTSVALPRVARQVASGGAPATSSTTGASGAP
jgi:hypothetical protein